MKEFEKMAEEIALKIWGNSPLPHEYGRIIDRQAAESQHGARISTTSEFISTALARAYEEGLKKAYSIAINTSRDFNAKRVSSAILDAIENP